MTPIDHDACRFRHDMEWLHTLSTVVLAELIVSAVPLCCDLEEEVRFSTGIDPSTALWPADIAADAIAAWKATR